MCYGLGSTARQHLCYTEPGNLPVTFGEQSMNSCCISPSVGPQCRSPEFTSTSSFVSDAHPLLGETCTSLRSWLLDTQANCLKSILSSPGLNEKRGGQISTLTSLPMYGEERMKGDGPLMGHSINKGWGGLEEEVWGVDGGRWGKVGCSLLEILTYLCNTKKKPGPPPSSTHSSSLLMQTGLGEGGGGWK